MNINDLNKIISGSLENEFLDYTEWKTEGDWVYIAKNGNGDYSIRQSIGNSNFYELYIKDEDCWVTYPTYEFNKFKNITDIELVNECISRGILLNNVGNA